MCFARIANAAALIGAAPTQMLEEAVHSDLRGLEGFCTVSAKVWTNRNLIVFPDMLRPGSFVEYEWDEGDHAYRVDHGDPDGRSIR